MKRKTKRVWLYSLIGMLLLMGFLHFQNNSIVTSNYTIHSDKLSQHVNGYKIVQLSDLHNKAFGKDQSNLIRKVKKLNPDIIVFTGDLVDSNRYDEKPSLMLMENLVPIAPVYYVTGNHEWWSGKFARLESKLQAIGVHVMRNTVEDITIDHERIQIIGIDDPAESNTEKMDVEEKMMNVIGKNEGNNKFKIMLSHRPELFSLYSEYGVDVVFTGHAHGGQFRIPFIGGLIAPNQGLFPTYTSGMYEEKDTTMVVNRGLGNSIIPIRIFNRPEIVAVTLTVDDVDKGK